MTADVGLLDAHAAHVAELDHPRRLRIDDLRVALEVFFASGSAYGPRTSDLPELLQLLRRSTAIDAVGVEATAAAFAEAEVLARAPSLDAWHPDDAWIERARRRFLAANRPWAMEAAAPTMDPADAVERLRTIDRLLAEARRGGWPSIAAVEALVEERAAILADGSVLIDALTDGIRAWSGSENDPVLDRLVADRQDVALLLAAGDLAVARRLLSLVDAGAGASSAFDTATREAAHERRLGEVMDTDGVSRAEAIRVIEAMDLSIASMIEAGLTPEEAVVAFAMADGLDLDLGLARRRAAKEGLTVVEALARMATARALDMTDDELRAFDLFRSHFAGFDNAQGGRPDDAVSIDDLRFVVANPHRFTLAQVTAAQAILDEPVLRNRLDSAAGNTDVLDSDVFGDTRPADHLISVADIDAFLIGAQLNHVLADHRIDIDTAAEGGPADGFVSERDLEAWLDANPDAPVGVREAVAHMLEAQLYDRTWLERNREALAMGAAVIAGGVVIVMTAGTATPLIVVMGAGFAAGAGAAGVTTLGVNHLTGEALTDGLLENSLSGGAIGMSVAGLPASWTSASAITQGLTVRSGLAAASFSGEVAGVVSGGGIDLVLPDDWEDEIHTLATGVEIVGAFAGAVETALDTTILWAVEPAEAIPNGWVSRTADNGSGTVWQAPGSAGNADMIRIMEPTDAYPNGYVRFHNAHGQPVDLTGRPGSRSGSHIPINPDGTFDVPAGWPS
ncbi:MAG: hypothetical protein AAF480_00350 [Actinomycetota bacterium]